jgi:hypothetical protein
MTCSSLTKYVLPTLLSVACGAAIAQPTLAGTPFVVALKEGMADATPPKDANWEAAVKAIQKNTGDNHEIILRVYRVASFKSQPTCGRVSFGPYQASTNTFWGQLGGQINLCEDGTPPLKLCPGSDKLVAHNRFCKDGSRPFDTPEVAAAIARAVKQGGITPEQMRSRMRDQAATDKSGGKP